jgi:beta-N-acetylhexosaminidase
VIVISALTPIYLSDLPWVETALAVYGWGADSYRAGFSALLGSFEPEGSLPVSLER